MGFKKNKNKVDPALAEANARKKSFQERLPIKDIKNRLFVDMAGNFYPVYQLGQKSIDLMTEKELETFASQLEMTFAKMSCEAIQFLLLPVPFDLAPYEKNQKIKYNELLRKTPELKNECKALINALINTIQKKVDSLALFDLGNEDNSGVINECEETIKLLTDILNGESYKDIITYKNQISQIAGVSFDLRPINNYLQNNEFLQYIENQINFTSRRMQGGKIANKHCFIVVDVKEKYNEIAVQEIALSIEKELRAVCPESRRCNEEEMQKILIELFNPLRPEIYINN